MDGHLVPVKEQILLVIRRGKGKRMRRILTTRMKKGMTMKNTMKGRKGNAYGEEFQDEGKEGKRGKNNGMKNVRERSRDNTKQNNKSEELMGEIVVNALGTEVQWRNQTDKLYSQVKMVTILSKIGLIFSLYSLSSN